MINLMFLFMIDVLFCSWEDKGIMKNVAGRVLFLPQSPTTKDTRDNTKGTKDFTKDSEEILTTAYVI